MYSFPPLKSKQQTQEHDELQIPRPLVQDKPMVCQAVRTYTLGKHRGWMERKSFKACGLSQARAFKKPSKGICTYNVVCRQRA